MSIAAQKLGPGGAVGCHPGQRILDWGELKKHLNAPRKEHIEEVQGGLLGGGDGDGR